MGAIADGIMAYGQPLLDATDGSIEQLNRACALMQLCFNLALLPDESRDEAISEMRLSCDLDDEEFDDFQRDIVLPMIRRHEEMFPLMHRRGSTDYSQGGPSPSGPSLRARPGMAASAEANPGTDRYAPCPCNSGRKYKFCCGKKGS